MIELKNISAGYGRHIVLESLTAEFEKGRLTSVIGVNGCGKSTLLKAICGILPIFGGAISIDNKTSADMSRKEIAKKAAYLAQGKSTPDMTVGQLVLHGRFPHLNYPRRYTKQDRDIALSAMERAGVAEFAEKPLYTLSGGMRQNAYIAMALAQDTDYILLDEPTTYLDIAHQLRLMKILRELSDGGKGIVAVMHDLPMAMTFSDKVVILNGGRTETSGTPADIYESGIIENIFGAEIGLSGDGKSFYYKY